MRVLYLWGLMALLLSSTLLAAPFAREVKETKIADFDATIFPNPQQAPLQWLLPDKLFPSRDFRHVMYLKNDGEKSCLVRDGVAGAWHEQIYLQPTSFTPDGHFYCWMRDGAQWTLIFDDREYHTSYSPELTPFISPDGKHIAFSCLRAKNGRCIVLDGVEGKWYSIDNTMPSVVFSPDGQHLAYSARTEGHWILVVDGKELPGNAKDIISMTFSPDSQHCVAVVQQNNQDYLQIDDERGKAYDRIEQLSFTPAGKPRFVAKTGDRWALINGDEERELPGYTRGLVMSADGKHIAYQSDSQHKTAMIIDGVTGPAYRSISFMLNVFTADNHTRYTAEKDDGKWVLVVDGKEMSFAEGFVMPGTSPDRKHKARQVAVERQGKVVVDGVDGALYDFVSTPIFSPDSQHVAYFARSGNQTLLVIDGQDGKPYDAVIAPSINRAHVVNTDADPNYQSPLLFGGDGLFVNDHQVRYLAYRDKAIYCVEETLK